MTDINVAAKALENVLSKDEGYIILVFPFGKEVHGQFATNVQTEDAIQGLKAYVEELSKLSIVLPG